MSVLLQRLFHHLFPALFFFFLGEIWDANELRYSGIPDYCCAHAVRTSMYEGPPLCTVQFDSLPQTSYRSGVLVCTTVVK
jgi:hypothetical protein